MSAKIPPDALQFYLSLGPGRSYEAVAQKYGVTKRGVVKHAQKENWQARILEIERKARHSSEQKAVESMEMMNDRHLRERGSHRTCTPHVETAERVECFSPRRYAIASHTPPAAAARL